MPNGQSISSKLEAKSTGLQRYSTSDGLYIRSFQYLKMISPRSSNYEHLEGGLGPSRPKRFAWKRFAVVAVAIVGLVYFFGPRQSRTLPWRTDQHHYGELFVTFVFLHRLS